MAEIELENNFFPTISRNGVLRPRSLLTKEKSRNFCILYNYLFMPQKNKYLQCSHCASIPIYIIKRKRFC